MRRFIDKLPERYRWTIHNTAGHAGMELLHQIAHTIRGIGDRIHDTTIPSEFPGEGGER